MNDAPVQLLVAVLDEEKTAAAVMDELLTARNEKLIVIESAVVLWRDKQNRLHISNGRWTPGKGAWGAAVVAASQAISMAIAGLLGKKQPASLENERLQRLGNSLQPGTSAIVAVIEHKWVAELEKEVDPSGTSGE